MTAEWSPCGRYLMTATVAPRLRVDNGFQARSAWLGGAPWSAVASYPKSAKGLD